MLARDPDAELSLTSPVTGCDSAPKYLHADSSNRLIALSSALADELLSSVKLPPR